MRVVRVGDHRLGKLLGGPGERAQHQHAGVVDARGDKFLGHQIQPVPQGCDQGHVGREVVGHQVFGVERTKLVTHRHPPLLPEPSVDPAHSFLDGPAEFAVGFALGAGGHGHLQKGEVVGVAGVSLQKQLDRLEPFQDSLGVVQPVGPQDQKACADGAPDCLRPLSDGRLGG